MILRGLSLKGCEVLVCACRCEKVTEKRQRGVAVGSLLSGFVIVFFKSKHEEKKISRRDGEKEAAMRASVIYI